MDKLNPKYNKPMRTYWDQWTGSYQHGAQKHRLYALDLFKRKGVKTLLDCGCGTGPIFELLLNTFEVNEAGDSAPRWSFLYKGTDYSFAMVDTAKENFPNGNFEVEDARHLTEPDNSWDCVFIMHTLDHIDDYKSVIREATRVSKKYVCIILWRSFVQEGTNLNSRNMMDKKEGEEPWKDTFLHEYSKQALEDEFKANNLVIDEVAEGELINSDRSSYNFLYLLKKNEQ